MSDVKLKTKWEKKKKEQPSLTDRCSAWPFVAWMRRTVAGEKTSSSKRKLCHDNTAFILEIRLSDYLWAYK